MKIKISLMIISAMACSLLISGCVTASTAPVAGAAGKIRIAVLSDRGNPAEMETRQWQYRNEVGSYMERDLINRLNRTGYNAQLISSKEEFVPGDASYLLTIKIKHYNPGSSAARIVVGFGAGACSLDMHYAVGNGSRIFQEWDDGIGTSMDWRRLPIALNDKLVRKLNAEILSWK